MRQILLYGLVLGALLLLMQVARYRLVFIQHSESLYTGLVAVVCVAAGIWGGMAITRQFQKKQTIQAPTQPETAGLRSDEQVMARLHITPREMDVLLLIAQGLSNQEIAERLFLSLNTIKTHVSNVFSKLDAQRRTQAIQKAKALGLLK